MNDFFISIIIFLNFNKAYYITKWLFSLSSRK